MLGEYGHERVLLGIKPGTVDGVDIQMLSDKPVVQQVDTVTLYIGPQNQPAWYDYLLSLKPKRIIFNPGTENDEFEQKARVQGIETVEGCTLVMLRSGQY